jgi:predicted AlkP superfamily pyrophosphatase or phosphodiesterase
VKEQPWHWYKSEIKVPTLYDIAKKSNMTVGALFWPVMAGAKVDYNLPEIWTMKEGESQLLLTLKSGRSPLFLFNINSKFGSLRDGTKQPQLDNFTAASAAYMIKTKKPNLALIHLTDLDHQRHKHGTNSQEAKDALKRQDERIGQIMQAAKDAGIYDDTTFVVLGDHAFKDVDYKICLNTEFRKQGLIDVDSKGNVTDWKVYANYCDGSVQIKLKNPDDSSVKGKVEDILNKLKNDPSSGIEAVYNQAQAKDKGVSGDFQYMAEARDGYYFSNDWLGDLIVKIDKNNIIEDDEYSYQATHGFDPLKPNYQTFFMACGSGVKKGVVIPSINIVDEGPTMAALLGLNMPDTDGRILNEMMK